MKTAEKLKERDLEPQFEALLQELLGRVPFLKLESLRREALLAPSCPERPDWLAKVRAGERRCTLVVEGRRIGQPREVRTSILQLQSFLERLPGKRTRYGVLFAPFISEE